MKNLSVIKSEKFIPSHPLQTAVLFMVFNRLNTTKRVFQAIRKAKPPRLYIAADGARENKEGEKEQVKAIREYVMDSIDWECEVKTLFREKNLGCKYSVNGAIDWFFKNEEMGIILEDDCLPNQSFFWFCEELLKKYKDDSRIAIISGDNFQHGVSRGKTSYYFSIFNHIWGWASWRRAWRYQDISMSDYPEFKKNRYIDKLFIKKGSKKYWLDIFDRTYKNKIDSWGYVWTFSCWSQNMLSILPNINLVSNVGFDEEAIHTTNPNDPSANIKLFQMEFPLNHPRIIMRNYFADKFEEETIFKSYKLLSRILLKIFYLLSKRTQTRIKKILRR